MVGGRDTGRPAHLPRHRGKLRFYALACQHRPALHFLRHNPAALQPVKRLCEYLQVSPAAVRELFRRHLGRSPQAVALEVRMQHARGRLAGGVAVKQIAFELGYRHANDFSRAYKRFFGTTTRAVPRK